MYYNTELHWEFANASTEIQDPKHMPQIKIPLSNHSSAEAPTENMHYETAFHRKVVYAIAAIQNPEQKLKM